MFKCHFDIPKQQDQQVDQYSRRTCESCPRWGQGSWSTPRKRAPRRRMTGLVRGSQPENERVINELRTPQISPNNEWMYKYKTATESGVILFTMLPLLESWGRRQKHEQCKMHEEQVESSIGRLAKYNISAARNCNKKYVQLRPLRPSQKLPKEVQLHYSQKLQNELFGRKIETRGFQYSLQITSHVRQCHWKF